MSLSGIIYWSDADIVDDMQSNCCFIMLRCIPSDQIENSNSP